MIKIDDRESKNFQSICDVFFNEYKIDHLLVGDIIVNDQVCFEHKKVPDFISSIYDGRLFKQIEQMKSNYQYSYIVVSGSITDIISTPKTNYNSLMAAIASCYVRGCPIIFCDNYEGVCSIIKILSKKLLDGKNRTIPIIEIPIDHDQLRLLCSIRGISETKGQALLDRFGSPMNVFNASKDALMEVRGIGDKIADHIREVLGETLKYFED